MVEEKLLSFSVDLDIQYVCGLSHFSKVYINNWCVVIASGKGRKEKEDFSTADILKTLQLRENKSIFELAQLFIGQ